jgi:hypothetical protein
MEHHGKEKPTLRWHFNFLSKIYSFVGWLGLLGGFFLLLSAGQGQNQQVGDAVQIHGMPQLLSSALLIAWSSLLLSFSKDLVGPQKWATGVAGWLIGAFHLISVPIGTAIGTYTLWILFHNRRHSID